MNGDIGASKEECTAEECAAKPRKKSFFRKFWPFKKKTKIQPIHDEPEPCEDEEIPSLPSMGGVDIVVPIGFRINRVDNGYFVVAEYQYNSGVRATAKQRNRQLVFGTSKAVADYIKKEFDKLEEEIKIEKLKQ